jgi:uncharacterized protein
VSTRSPGLAGRLIGPDVRRAAIVEIALVLGLPTVLFLTGCVLSMMRVPGTLDISNARFLRTIGEEAVIVAVLLPFLWRRGWKPGAIAGSPEPFDVVRGGLIWLGSYAAYCLAVGVLLTAVPSLRTAFPAWRYAGGVTASVAVATALLNPLFEEFLWLGYAVTALGSRIGLRAACMVSVALRVAIHSYQGPMGVVGVVPMAVVFTWYYARTGRLWPIVVAHVIADAAALGALAATRH